MAICYSVGGLNPDVNPSPVVWKAMMCLHHKGIPFEVQGLKYREIRTKIKQLSDGKWDRVPYVVFEDGSSMFDSDQIARQLEEKFPEKAKLFPNGYNFFKFMSSVSSSLFFPVFLLAFPNFLKTFEPEDLKAFNNARLEQLKVPLDTLVANNDKTQALGKVKSDLKPFVEVLQTSKFLEGDSVTYSDYHFFGFLQFLKISSHSVFEETMALDETNTLTRWFDSISELYDGFARKSRTISEN